MSEAQPSDDFASVRWTTISPSEAKALADRVRMDADFRRAVQDALDAWKTDARRRASNRVQGHDEAADARWNEAKGAQDG